MQARNERIEEALRMAAAEFLSREAGAPPLGGLITVTGAQVSEDAGRAVVRITVLPESYEGAALEFANRNRGEVAAYFRSRVRGVRPPRLMFELDRGEKNRQRLDELSK